MTNMTLSTPIITPNEDSTALKDIPLVIGSQEHKIAFCGVLLDTFDPYKPAVIAWPKLSEDARKRLTDLPFWDVAIETEGLASCRMKLMGETATDPLIKKAIDLNAFEEERHKYVIHHMLDFYNIPTGPEKSYTAGFDAEWYFLRTGYGECFDSFFAFGLFKMAQESGFFPPELVEVFEPVVREESRHILFFVNWVAYTAASKNIFARILFRMKCLAALGVSALGRMSLASANDGGKSTDNFVAVGGETLTVGLTPRKLIEVALEENEKRMSLFNRHLTRPQMMPFIARNILKLMKMFGIH